MSRDRELLGKNFVVNQITLQLNATLKKKKKTIMLISVIHEI